jgi:hypothetical protein
MASIHYEALRQMMSPTDWAYHDANGTPLRGPCADTECRYMSAPGGSDHGGPHSWQDGTTGYAHDYGQPCACETCAPVLDGVAPHIPGTDYYDGRDGSIEAEDDDEDRIAAEDAAARDYIRDLTEWQREMGA